MNSSTVRPEVVSHQGRMTAGSGLVIKIILSGTAIWAFFVLLHLTIVSSAANPFLGGAGISRGKIAALPEKQGQPGLNEKVFWPHLPGCFNKVAHQMTINGVDTVSEDWQISLPRADVISYYREQMEARGWRDTTEEDCKLQPESRNVGLGNDGVQNPGFVEKYASTMDSTLILKRSPWSIQILAVPSDKGSIHQTSVRMFAAATPSIKEFCLSIGAEAFKASNSGSLDGSIDTVQESSGQRCYTKIAVKKEAADVLFNQILKEYHDKDWHSMILRSGQPGQPGYFAWLMKGKAYAALAVKPLPTGKNSSITITEITPQEVRK